MPPIFKSNGIRVVRVANSGQAVQLPGGFSVNRVDIQALSSNVGVVVIGDGTVLSDQSAGGVKLGISTDTNGNKTGDVYSIEIIVDMSQIYVNGLSGDGVAITYWLGDRN